MEPIVIAEDAVYIYDESGTEIVSWIEDEWITEPIVVLAILNAVVIRLTQGSQALKDKINGKVL